MKSTITRITFSGFLLLLLLFNSPLGQVKNIHAQADTGWSEPINLSNSGASSDPSIVVDSKGVIHVIWLDALDGYKYAQSTDGIIWSVPVTVDFPFDPDNDSRPKLIADASGSIHIFWRKLADENIENDTTELFYGRASSIFLSQPLSWAKVEIIADSVLDFDVLADSRSVIHLSYVKNLATDKEPAGIYYRRLDGRSWAPAIRLYSSQYFRTLTLDESHVRLAVAGSGRTGNVYAVWDDRPSKRIFVAKSIDGGVNWQGSVQLQGPEDATGLALPYNVNASATGKNVLISWQLGQPGSLCSQYSEWSTDGVETLSEPTRVSDELKSCPTSGMFIGSPPGYFLLMLDQLGDLSLVAWNGMDWSSLQPQPELNSFSNPFTLDQVILSCRQVTYHADTIFIVGCDQASTGDIWFRYRKFGSLQDWFPPPSAWAGPNSVSSVNQEISSSVAVADTSGGFHMMWIQYSSGSAEASTATVQYARWDSEKWSSPTNIITGLPDIPHYLTATPDEQGGVLLAWVQGLNGEIYFSRANGDKAYLASEWTPALRIPSLSELNTMPDMLVDSTNRIVLVYSIPFNENRGIYLVQSDDFGKNWSDPIRVFDAVAVNWDSVIQPEIELSKDGRLHLLVTRNSLREGDQQSSLYYLQSMDGGATWTTPVTVSERSVQWSEIILVGEDVLYRLWQERNEDVFEVFSELSSDGGLTWSGPQEISSVDGSPAALSLAKDPDGQLFMLQSHIEGESLLVEEINWDGSRWNTGVAKMVSLKQEPDRYFVASGIASDRSLHYLVAIDYPSSAEDNVNEILGYTRFLNLLSKPQILPSILIPTPAESNTTKVPVSGPTPTKQSPLEGLEETSDTRVRNLVGLALVVGIVIVTLVIVRPYFRRKQK